MTVSVERDEPLETPTLLSSSFFKYFFVFFFTNVSGLNKGLANKIQAVTIVTDKAAAGFLWFYRHFKYLAFVFAQDSPRLKALRLGVIG